MLLDAITIKSKIQVCFCWQSQRKCFCFLFDVTRAYIKIKMVVEPTTIFTKHTLRMFMKIINLNQITFILYRILKLMSTTTNEIIPIFYSLQYERSFSTSILQLLILYIMPPSDLPIFVAISLYVYPCLNKEISSCFSFSKRLPL